MGTPTSAPVNWNHQQQLQVRDARCAYAKSLKVLFILIFHLEHLNEPKTKFYNTQNQTKNELDSKAEKATEGLRYVGTVGSKAFYTVRISVSLN